MESIAVSKDLEEYDPEAKLQKDEQEGINIETMSLSGDDIDNDIDNDIDGVDTYIPQQVDEKEEEEEKNSKISDTKKEIEEDILNLGPQDESKMMAENLGISTEIKSSTTYSSDSDDDDFDYNQSMKKIEQDINKDILFEFHPETKQINYKELLTLSNVVRNKRGHIIDPLHTTVQFLTCYEKAKILGMRAKQINNGAKPFVDVPKSIIDGHTIALMELNKQKMPFIIRRPIPNGGSEYWKVSDLKMLE